MAKADSNRNYSIRDCDRFKRLDDFCVRKIKYTPLSVNHLYLGVNYIQVLICWLYKLYTYLIRLAKAEVTRKRMSNAYTPERRKDLKNGTTLLCIAFLFIACQIPKIFPDFYEALNCNHTKVRKFCIEINQYQQLIPITPDTPLKMATSFDIFLINEG